MELKDLQHISRKNGLYLLIKDGKIVYIGQSGNIYTRILEHLTEKKKYFDLVIPIYNENKTLTEIVEVGLIDMMKPTYNKLVIDRKVFFMTLPYIVKKETTTFSIEDYEVLVENAFSALKYSANKHGVSL